MKLLKKCCVMLTEATKPTSPTLLTEQENFPPADVLRIDPDLFAETEEDPLDVGVAMPQDVLALDFLEGYRRRIPEVHEEFPPHGLSWNDYATDT